jgi:hypothetical protein
VSVSSKRWAVPVIPPTYHVSGAALVATAHQPGRVVRVVGIPGADPLDVQNEALLMVRFLRFSSVTFGPTRGRARPT